MVSFKGVFIASCAIVLAGNVAADEKQDFDDFIISIQTDNDFYFSDRDEEYTNGQRLNVSFPFRKEPKWLMKAVDWFPVGEESKFRRYSLTFGQSVFTPRDVSRPDIVITERPYAAYGYLGAGYADPKDFHTDLFNINVGVTGKLALGEAIQKTLHDLKGSKEPQGWVHQHGEELTLMAQFVRMHAGREGSLIGGDYWDVTPHSGFSLGTPNSHLMGGVTFRVGTAIGREAGGLPVLQPQMIVHDIYRSDPSFAFNVVAGIESRLVLYDFSLDGSLFGGNKHTVEKKTFVTQAHLGFVAYYRGWRWGYTHIIESKRYDLQKRRHTYGSITLSRYF
ncbi:lipid A deacylase LpxR family protein [Temperatibacter marinus]|uniref:Lipid A deacylase LpxR family protein n=1 Tax=Temperatibacter marinus TaxID=1456591 RepID=A0AA52EFQ2_9PROT|nr:lipid A deacylase LpxR family protein [Temperatibacter marinus]WND01990.1 lipid A deacylase LpxR family protein [Temperatibacter marinus]